MPPNMDDESVPMKPSLTAPSLLASVFDEQHSRRALTREVLLHSRQDDGYRLYPHLLKSSGKNLTSNGQTYIVRKPA